MAVKQIFDSFIPSESIISKGSKRRRKKETKRKAVTSVVSQRAKGRGEKGIEEESRKRKECEGKEGNLSSPDEYRHDLEILWAWFQTTAIK